MSKLKTKIAAKLKASVHVDVSEREIIFRSDSKKGINGARNRVVFFAKLLRKKLLAANSAYKHLDIYAYDDGPNRLIIKAEYPFMTDVKGRMPIL